MVPVSSDGIGVEYSVRNFYVFTLLIIGTFCWSKGPKRLHFIFDIDWTLTYNISKEVYEAHSTDDSFFRYKNEYYRITDHAGEMFRAIRVLFPDAEISLFSAGGTDERNKMVAQKIKLPTGEPIEVLLSHIWSKNDVTRVSFDKSLKYAEQVKKFVNHLVQDFSQDRFVLFDDSVKFGSREIPNPRNIPTLKVYGRNSYYHEMKDVPLEVKGPYIPSSEKLWSLERNKMSLLVGLLIEAKQMRFNQPERSFPEILVDLVIDPETKDHRSIDDLFFEKFFVNGHKFLKNLSENEAPVPLPYRLYKGQKLRCSMTL